MPPDAIDGQESALVLSAEVYTIPLSTNRYLVYAPVRRAAFVANSSLVNLIADLKDGCYQPSKETVAAIEFLRQLQIVDGGPEAQPIETFIGLPEPTNVTLFLTTVCNLRCTYCYASAGDRPVKSMKLETAKRGIDFVVRNALKRQAGAFEVGYHGGGEPTVLWSVLTQSHAYARQRASETGLRLQSSSATNGVLSDDKIDWVIGNLNSVTISFDGLPQAQDKHRLTVLGQGSSARVEHTMRRLDAAGYRYGVRMTVTQDNIPLLAESVEYVLSNFKPSALQVEPSYRLGRWQGAPSAETEDFISAFRDARSRAKGFAQDLHYSGARVGTLTNHFCGISRDSFSLSPDGNVSACFEVFAEDLPWADHFFYGRPSPGDPGYQFNEKVLAHLRSQSVEHREYCHDCFAKWSCAGDCYHKALSETGSEEFVGTERCHITREITKDQILDKIAAAGGLFWHEEGVTKCTNCGGAAHEQT
jgi:uncharacterized protein